MPTSWLTRNGAGPWYLGATCFVGLLIAASGHAQTPAPRFDVASVRQNIDASGSLQGGSCHGTNSNFVATTVPGTPREPDAGVIAPGSCRFGRTTLKEIVAAAYAIPRRDFERLIVGGPKWVGTDRFDIQAKAERPHTQAELEQMLQALLADRFGLRLHRETREVDGFSLVTAKTGAKLKVADSAIPPRIRTVGIGSLTASATPMQRFVVLLTTLFDKPVADETGLRGQYDFTLKWTPSDSESTPFGPIPPDMRQRLEASADSFGPSIFTALEEQLGLRLQPQKIRTEMLVIDEATHPSPN